MQPQVKKKTKFQELQSVIDPKVRQLWEEQQKKIQKIIIQADQFDWKVQDLNCVAGVDLSAAKNNPDIACAGLVIYDVHKKKIIYDDYQIIQISQPYIPGFLAFREIPPLYRMFEKFKINKPQIQLQLIFLDGNGILHPNGCGLASHLGVLLNIPSIGVGKTLFYIDGLARQTVKVQCQEQIHQNGDFSLLKGESGRVWGAALRNTQNSINPIFVSIGTKISLKTAIQCVMKLSFYRVVEPIRLADKNSRQLIEKYYSSKNKQQQLVKYQMIYIDQIK